MRKHNEKMRNGKMQAERKQRHAENFRQDANSDTRQKVPKGNDHRKSENIMKK
jgi:hypothetical protein